MIARAGAYRSLPNIATGPNKPLLSSGDDLSYDTLEWVNRRSGGKPASPISLLGQRLDTSTSMLFLPGRNADDMAIR